MLYLALTLATAAFLLALLAFVFAYTALREVARDDIEERVALRETLKTNREKPAR